MARPREWNRDRLLEVGLSILRSTEKEYGAACLDKYELRREGYTSVLNMLAGGGGDYRARFYQSIETFRRTCIKKYEQENLITVLGGDPRSADDRRALAMQFRKGFNLAANHLNYNAQIQHFRNLSNIISEEKESGNWFKKYEERIDEVLEKLTAKIAELEKKGEPLFAKKKDGEGDPVALAPWAERLEPHKKTLSELVKKSQFLKKQKKTMKEIRDGRVMKTYGSEVRTIHGILLDIERAKKQGKYPDLSPLRWYKKKILREYGETASAVALRIGGLPLYKHILHEEMKIAAKIAQVIKRHMEKEKEIEKGKKRSMIKTKITEAAK